MKLLLDENVPLPMARIVRLLLKHHVVEHVAELDQADSRRLISLNAVDPSQQSRLRIVDPASAPPKFWPTDSQG
ncbi:hypothetical protein [Kitasatospora purpeofusca]|uniref:hypothetical protein n=1 Tax=Kitasatospora purpeofusca TaxID=67352 RepID=UPI003868C0E8|nr:hypothetical protein OIP63_18870 [Kitasatospora purpeofusca]